MSTEFDVAGFDAGGKGFHDPSWLSEERRAERMTGILFVVVLILSSIAAFIVGYMVLTPRVAEARPAISRSWTNGQGAAEASAAPGAGFHGYAGRAVFPE